MALKGFDTTRFEAFIKDLIEKDRKKKISIQKNGIPLAESDPFSALFECATLGITIEDWLETYESRRLRQKTLQNHIGKLHEIAISCLPGWKLSDSTADVENQELKIIAEVKNKHNTMNSSSALATYNKLEQLVDGAYEGYQSYVVQIIPNKSTKPYSTHFQPSDSKKKQAKKCPARDDIRIIDGESFYTIANQGDPDTLNDIFDLMGKLLVKHLGDSAKPVLKSDMAQTFINAIRPTKRS